MFVDRLEHVQLLILLEFLYSSDVPMILYVYRFFLSMEEFKHSTIMEFRY